MRVVCSRARKSWPYSSSLTPRVWRQMGELEQFLAQTSDKKPILPSPLVINITFLWSHIYIYIYVCNHLDHNLYKMLSSVPVIERFIYIKMTSPDQHFIVISLYSEVWSYNRAFYRCFPFATNSQQLWIRYSFHRKNIWLYHAFYRGI